MRSSILVRIRKLLHERLTAFHRGPVATWKSRESTVNCSGQFQKTEMDQSVKSLQMDPLQLVTEALLLRKSNPQVANRCHGRIFAMEDRSKLVKDVRFGRERPIGRNDVVGCDPPA